MPRSGECTAEFPKPFRAQRVPGPVSDWRIRRRTRLKHKEAHALRDEVAASLGGLSLWPDDAAVEVGEAPDFDVVLVDNEPVALRREGSAFLTVRGLLKYRPASAYVTVDMGAVRFVHNGADVMAPGIVDADPGLDEGDWCWIRDERNRQPLAVGRCIMPGADMATVGKGKAVQSVHYLGDKLWAWGQD